jgi:hypothetical protein
MCDPVTMGVLSIGSSLMTSAAANKAANAQSEYQDRLHAENRRRAEEAAIVDYQQIASQEAQAGEAAVQKQMANDLQAREMTARASAAETGAIDNTGAVGSQFIRQGLEANTQIGQNLAREREGFGLERQAATNRAYSRIQSVAKGRGKVKTLSGLDIAQAGIAGVQGYSAAGGTKASFKKMGDPTKYLS